ncbi:hypothetical protein K457DRAFT_705141 [Linnemannia elongata AG-77]|uniref:Uncharacterized protein n=1 Tax=Linnemannia elongata AG-77 TaxID=1314771 RepID=A0A197JPH4_9FUNG|nr:hypothetical protein K457DRAFT_705141 [Linnemannia elongata AG-77]
MNSSAYQLPAFFHFFDLHPHPLDFTFFFSLVCFLCLSPSLFRVSGFPFPYLSPLTTRWS